MAGYTPMGCKYGKKHMVFKATQKPIDGISLSNRDYKFYNGNFFYMNDAGAAKELDSAFGAHRGGTGDVVVVEKEFREPGHAYRFWHSGVPWTKKDDGPWEEYAPGKWRHKNCQ